MPGLSQPAQDGDPAGDGLLTVAGESPPAADESLTAAEVRALAAADRADGGGWPLPQDAGAMPAELQALSDVELEGVYAAAVAAPAGSGMLEQLWPLSYPTAEGYGPGGDVSGGGEGAGDGEPGWGFAEGGMLDEAVPSLILAGFAEDACGQLGRLDDDSLTGVMRACRRLVAQAQARELAVVAELARRRPVSGPVPGPDGAPVPGRLVPEQVSEHAADEVAVALTLTGRAAQRHVGLAVNLAVHWRTAAALAAGRIDLPKALVMLDAICPLGEIEAAAVEAAVLPCAGGLTTGQLRAWLARLVLSVDPAAARRRREQAERQAHVACWADPEGTATLAGRFLPPAEVLAADQRIAAIAEAWKKAGAYGGLDLLRAHAYLALLLGQDTTTPPAVLLTSTTPDTPPSQHTPTPAGPGTSTPPDGPPGRGTAGSPDGPPGCGTSNSPDGPPGPETPASPDSKGEEPDPGPVPAGSRPAGDSAPALPVTGTVNLTIPLITLLGLADRPGEVPGYGPLHADTARDIAQSMSGHSATRWNVIITDPAGRAMGFGGSARARRVTKIVSSSETSAPGAARGTPIPNSAGIALVGEGGARGSPISEASRGSPTLFGAGGWTITVTTEPIAPYY